MESRLVLRQPTIGAELCQRVQRRNRAISPAATSTTIRMIVLETSPVRMASVRLADAPGMVAGSMAATKITPKTKGNTRPVTEAVLRIVTTRAMIRPIRKMSVNCDSTRSVKAARPFPDACRAEASTRPRPGLSTCAYLALSPAKMSFLWVPPGTNSTPTITVMTAITMAYHRPE